MHKIIAVTILAALMLAGCSMPFDKLPFFHGSDYVEENEPQAKTVENKELVQTTEKTVQTEQIDPEFLLEEQYFNVVQTVNGQPVIQNPDNILVLVNKDFFLPVDYKPNDLTVPNIQFSFGDADVPKRYLRKEAAAALEQLFAAAKKEGVILFGASGFRSYDRQVELFEAEKKQKGEQKAVQAVAKPGQSEHQTGLSIDVTSESVDFQITEKFGETKEGKWLQQNAHKFGYIIRYPKGKEAITKYKYEPWHIRYVGKKAAKVIYENNLTLEEYFQIVKKI
ncbi:M15 family metallopeptidase [Aeribacillus composti]|uniref:M15 family metallopeptidase n=1 Tax=Aeribacillus composti TaxID=1868734 RepID=UPI002E1B3437|nr:M15 family metallopeptidase [Aeribacillus composti]